MKAGLIVRDAQEVDRLSLLARKSRLANFSATIPAERSRVRSPRMSVEGRVEANCCRGGSVAGAMNRWGIAGWRVNEHDVFVPMISKALVCVVGIQYPCVVVGTTKNYRIPAFVQRT